MRPVRHAGIVLALAATWLAGCASLVDTPRETVPRGEGAEGANRVVVTVRDGGRSAPPGVGSTGLGYGSLARYRASPPALRAADAIAASHALRAVAAWPIELLGVHCIVYAFDADRDLSTVIAQLRADGRVESAQPMHAFRSLSSGGIGYDDPYLDLQSALDALQVTEAHRWSQGDGVRVAVIDSAVDAGHRDLAGRIRLWRDVTDAAGPRAAREVHGTAVAGLIAAAAGNGEGIVGVAPGARVLAVRACWQDGTGTASCNTFTLARALALALSEGAQVINLSLAGPRDPLLERLVARAVARGRIIVAAVPEEGRSAFPAAVPGVVAVASAEALSALEGEVLRAPGRNVLTLRPGGGYDFENGSSMAAAQVSGIAALLLALDPSLGPMRITALLQRGTLRTVPTAAGERPMVNACRAVVAVAGRGECGELRRMHATLR